MIEIFGLALQCSMIALFVGGLYGWWRIGRNGFGNQHRHTGSFMRNLENVLPTVDQQRPTWTPADFLIAFGFRIALPLFLASLLGVASPTNKKMDTPTLSVVEEEEAATVVREEATRDADRGQPQDQPSLVLTPTDLWIQLLAMFGSIVLTLSWLSILHRDSWRRIGFSTQTHLIKLGLKSTPIILSAVMVFSLLASAIVEYEHPVLESLLREQSFPFLLMTFAVTAIATPVFEEFLFRGLLQGSLQALADSDPSTETWKPEALWPLLLTSGLFALMHLGQGAAPIPIFILSLGLGFLYRQTGSLIPPIIVHMILNSVTLLDTLLTNSP
ncbi:MAG: CPBP family intramembrane glutamic endopeptidase [Planctomycetota bacterium]|nr:CPBP family intramembrane glutamic endopeptidase [Planctomycetota bacterium]